MSVDVALASATVCDEALFALPVVPGEYGTPERTEAALTDAQRERWKVPIEERDPVVLTPYSRPTRFCCLLPSEDYLPEFLLSEQERESANVKE